MDRRVKKEKLVRKVSKGLMDLKAKLVLVKRVKKVQLVLDKKAPVERLDQLVIKDLKDLLDLQDLRVKKGKSV